MSVTTSQHGLMSRICTHWAQSASMLGEAISRKRKSRLNERASKHVTRSENCRAKEWDSGNSEQQGGAQERFYDKGRIRLKAKCEKLITMSLSHVSAFLLKVIVRLACDATPLIHNNFLVLAGYCSRGTMHTRAHSLFHRFCPAHDFIVIHFPFVHHYRFFYRLAEWMLAHSRNNSITM